MLTAKATGPRPVQLKPGVSVIIPSFQGRQRIETCLRSLAAQTLTTEMFEVIVVLNGPPDGTRSVLESFHQRHPGLDMKVLVLSEAGTSRARNAGIAEASRDYTTFVDDDDTVSPSYLKTLLAQAGPLVVPFAQIVDVGTAGYIDPANPINMQTIRYAGRTVHPEQVPRALGFNACKLIPTDLVKTVNYDTALDSGVDVVFFMTLLAHHDLRIRVCPVDNGPGAENAIYYRLLRPGSMSRRDMTFEFSVIGRLEVISRLDALGHLCDERRRRVLQMTMSAQAGHINRYLDAHPGELDRVLRAIDSYAVAGFPFHSLKSHLAGRTSPS